MDSQANHLRERRQLGAADRIRGHPIRSTILGAIACALATIALVVASGGNNSALAASSLVNGNFETGDLSGWSVDTSASGGEARAVTSYCPFYPETCAEQGRWYSEVFPKEGSYFALLQPAMWMETAREDAIITQSFRASNGDRVSGWAFFLAEDWNPGCYGGLPYCGWNEVTGQVVIRSDSGETVATPFQQSYSRLTGGGNSGWVYWEHTFTDLTGEGSFQLEARTHGNYGMLSSIGLDDVKTSTGSPAPPPSDTTAPDTTITSGPNSPTNNTAPTFTFSGSDNVTITANLKYQYRLDPLDSGGWSAASTSTTANLTGLSEGTHLFEVRAVDEAGNVDGSPAPSSFTVDTTQPMVNGTTPSGVKRVERGTDLTATFTEEMEPSTVNTTTFMLYKVNSDGTQTQITDVVVSLSSDGLTATLNPFGEKVTLLARSTTYKGVITTGTKDLAGNSLAQQKSWTFTTKS